MEAGVGTHVTWAARIINMGNTDGCIRIGSNCIVRGELLTFAHGGKITVGDDCYVGENSRVWSGASIEIGNHVMISHDVSIFDNLTHPIKYLERRDHYTKLRISGHPSEIDLEDSPITIGDDVWIAAHVIVLRGVKIGARSVIGAGSVVLCDIPPNVIVGGNPARIIRSI